jgi:hypothetical protein
LTEIATLERPDVSETVVISGTLHCVEELGRPPRDTNQARSRLD